MNVIYLAEDLALITDIDVTIIVYLSISIYLFIYLCALQHSSVWVFRQCFLSTWSFLHRESLCLSICVKTRSYFPHFIPPADTVLWIMQRTDK